ncbi:MAG: integrase/recombinase XerD, partial [Thermoleophilaceae bacterium]|nr:integrase/recombinase XerD [Thermoleophilaceae bacterium]
KALSGRELAQLLAAPNLGTVIGIRDRAILVLLARAGLRRSELARLTLTDVQESGREPDKRRRVAIAAKRAGQTPLEVVVRGTTRGRTRSVPLQAQAQDALSRWYAVRPAAVSDALFVSLRNRPSARPEPLSAGAVSDIVAKHAAASSVRRDRRTAHSLRHTFCTMLAERGVALQVIKALAGHSDIRTTEIYLDVTEQRKADGIAERKRSPHPRAA